MNHKLRLIVFPPAASPPVLIFVSRLLQHPMEKSQAPGSPPEINITPQMRTYRRAATPRTAKHSARTEK